MTDDEFDAFLALAREELAAKQEALEAGYGVGFHERFVVEYRTSVLTFFDGEAPAAEARIVPVATHVPAKGSLRWGWANEQLPPEVRNAASRVKELGDLTGFDQFAIEAVECDEVMAWDIVAMACKHLDALGAYRVPHGGVFTYVLIMEIRKFAR